MKAPEQVNRELLKKYDKPGPRYTSYPTVPEWSDKFGPEQYIEALTRAAERDEPLALYIHLPFCKSRCYYCGCTTVVSSKPEKADRYIDCLEKEIAMVRPHLGRRNKVVQMHWGGGTPTFLSCEQIERLFGLVKDAFEVLPDNEVAIEVDPRATSFEQLELLRRLGFNRISMGVQDLNAEVQEAIGRNQSETQTKELFRKCRELGFGGINVDLIYGLPQQSVENFQRTIDEVMAMGADRVAVYSFAYLPSVKPHQRMIKPETLPTPASKYELFAAAVNRFVGGGYVQIGMDHFAKPEDELARSLARGELYRNFMGYTTRYAPASLGLGMSSISEVAGCFAQNISRLKDYRETIAAGKLATFRGCQLTADDHIRQQAILAIMCNFVLAFDEFGARLNIDARDYFSLELERMKPFIEDGFLEVDDNALRVLPRGRVFVRNIAMEFDAYLQRKGEEGANIFSRTV